MKKVKIEGLGAAVFNILDAYADDVNDKSAAAIDVVAMHTGEKVKQEITAQGIGGTKYKNSIAVKVHRGRLLSEATIYSPKHYQLTHLLEHGHIIKAHGKVCGSARAFPHWKPAEDAAIKELEEKIKRAVKS